MIVRVWGIVNNTEVEFQRIPEKPGYWEGYAPRVKGLQSIQVWAENDRGAKGIWRGQVLIEWHTRTQARLFLAPYSVHLLDDCQNGRDCTPYLTKKLEGLRMTEITTVYAGERKRIRCVIESLNQGPFEVSSASFELIHNDEVESIGDCEISQIAPDTVILSALVQPMIAKTTYKLAFNYDIYPEKLKYFCNVRTVIG